MSRLKELLERAKARSLQLEQQRELQKQTHVISQEIDLNPDRRADNLRLLRAYINSNQDGFVEMLRLGSQSNYSKIERGETPLAESDARRIESELGLPTGWFERNNGDTLFLSNNESQLIKALRQAPTGSALALNHAIKTLLTNH